MNRVMTAIALSGFVLTAATAASAQATAEQAPADKGKAMFDKVDTNHDGVITLDEWTAIGRRQRGFDMIDADHDGKVTPDELRAAAAKYGR